MKWLRPLPAEVLERIVALCPEMICITTLAEGVFVYVNDLFLEATGYERQEVLGRPSNNWPDAEARKALMLRLSDGKPVRNHEADFIMKDGGVRHALLHMQLVELSGVPCVLTVARDITKERVWMEESFHRKLFEDMRQTMRSLPNAVFRLERNETGKLVYTLSEGKIAEELGLTTDRVLGKSEADIFDAESSARTSTHIQKAMGGEYTQLEIELDGRSYHKIMAPYYKEDQIQGVVGAVVDVTDRKKLETLLQRSEMNAVLGQLAAGAAHEIRNPLAAIKGFVQLAGELFDRSGIPKGREYVNLALTELARVNGLVTEMLWLRKPKESVYEAVAVNELLESMLPLLHVEANIKSIQVTMQLEVTPDIKAKRDLLKQVILNLCKNGIEAMGDGGMLSIYTWYADGPNQVIVRIRDNGPGIPDELKEMLFTPFFTTKENGNGLGLFICRQIIEDMGGDIRITSDKRGTVVTLSFPVEDIVLR